METFVEGIRIKLTVEQIAIIEKARRRRKRARNSFAKMLRYFGFKQMPDQPDCWHNDTMGWYAEIQNYRLWDEVWMVGKGLPCFGFPGGRMYGSPEEIETEILTALENSITNYD